MKATQHLGMLDRPATGIIDSQERLLWALDVLREYDVPVISVLRQATRHDMGLVHDYKYIDGLHALSKTAGALLDPELYFDEGLWRSAVGACGALLDNVDHVLDSSEWRFALSRPGSHHATATYALGGCVVNNLAVAARHAQSKGIERVAILDFDAHHGNGTQDIFLEDETVLTISLHQGKFFPGTGDIRNQGVANSNYPLTFEDNPIEAYKEALEKTISFDPQLILFEAGVDGHEKDWTTDLMWTDSTYQEIGKLTKEKLAGVPAVFEFGGGYTEEAVREGLSALLKGLL